MQPRPTELLQVKHHVAPGSLSDASEDIWPTITVWLDAHDAAGLDFSDVALLLLSTSTASPGSAASLLRSDRRERDEALARLEATARTSTNQATVRCTAASWT